MRLKKQISLISTLINSHYSISKQKYTYFKKKKNRWEPLMIIGTIAVLVFSLAPLYKDLMEGMLSQYTQLGMENMFLMGSIIISGLMGLFFGIFLLVNTFFFSNDLRVLIPLPFKPREVLNAKFIVIILDQLLISLVLLLPPLIYFGLKMNVSPVYWVYSVFIFLLSQMFPIAFVTVLLLPLSRVLKFNRHKDFWIFFISALVLVGSMIFVSLTNKMAVNSDMDEQAIMQLLSDPDGLLNKMASVYPPAIMAVKALTAGGISGLLWFAGFLGLNFGLYGLVLWFGNKFYYSTYSEMQENYASRKSLKKGELAALFSVQNSKFRALLAREWRYFLRVPSFSFNGLSAVLAFPILLIIFSTMKNSAEFQGITEFIEKGRDFIIPAGILMGVLAGAMSTVASSIFSREGKLLRELKILPISPELILKIKLTHTSMVGLIGAVSAGVAVALIANANLIEVFSVILVSMTVITFLNLLQFLVDISRPVLEWDNPQKAMKQNLNSAVSIPIVFGFVGGMGYLGYLSRNVLNPIAMILILLAIGIVGSATIWPVAVRATKRLLRKDLTI